MKKILALFVVAILAFAAAPARAEVFVWLDPVYRIKVTFPDNWMRQAQLDDNLRLQILGPQGMDHVACRLYVDKDNRFMQTAAYAGQDLSGFVFDANAVKSAFIERPDTDNVRMGGFSNHGTLGKAAATVSDVYFQKNWAGESYAMRALVLGSQYRGKAIMMSCEALATGWQMWEPTLKSIMKSVDFPAEFAPFRNGLYRTFQDEGWVYLPVNRRKDAYTIR